MNLERMIEHRNRLARLPAGAFDMRTFGTPCGTAACNAGWCAYWNGGGIGELVSYGERGSCSFIYTHQTFNFAMNWLDLTREQAEQLFLGRDNDLMFIEAEDSKHTIALMDSMIEVEMARRSEVAP